MLVLYLNDAICGQGPCIIKDFLKLKNETTANKALDPDLVFRVDQEVGTQGGPINYRCLHLHKVVKTRTVSKISCIPGTWYTVGHHGVTEAYTVRKYGAAFCHA